ncbi:MAG: sucrase ferredoxin [Oscillatoriaceae cyanobacterium Prado104]|jgi:hypothetical protein|nr:sucrase ferredoxin [Oscillatoriaceae cyanobacterium Prado104]
MDKFFCADASKCAQEDIIGSGSNYQTYVLIECCLPWESEAFNSKAVPQNLRDLVEEVESSKQKVRFLLVNSETTKGDASRKVLIYDNKNQDLFGGYEKHEFNAASIDKVASIVKSYLAGKVPDCEIVENQITRDILICTHGSHDMCCARYGNPFYAQAKAVISELDLREIRLWKASHFGGHRFAPTAIDLPDGRYYGNLDRPSFQSILTRSGDIECLDRVYRGWGILPTAMQVVERELMRRYGWDWFNYKVSGCIVDRSENDRLLAEITFQKPDGTYTYRADLVKDETKTIRLKGSCGAKKESEFVKYSVENLYFYSTKEWQKFVVYPAGSSQSKLVEII